MTLEAEFEFVIKAIGDELQDEVEKFYDELIDTSPIDTGDFVNAWSINHPTDGMSYIIKNDMDYADVLARGRVSINGRMYGSLGNNPIGSWAIPLALKINNLERQIEKGTDDIHA